MQSYSVYRGVLYTLTALWCTSLLLCVYIGYCFKRKQAPYAW